MVASPSSLAAPLLDASVQLDSTNLRIPAEPQFNRATPALPPLAPTGAKPASIGAVGANALARLQALPRPGMEAADEVVRQLASNWSDYDRGPKERLRDEQHVVARDTKCEQQQAPKPCMEVAYQVDFPSRVLSDFKLVSSGRFVTEINYDDGKAGVRAVGSSSQVFLDKSSGGVDYVRVFSSQSFSMDLASVLLRAGIATAAFFMNAAVLLALSASTPAARTLKYLLGCACAISASTQLGVAIRIVREESPDPTAEAKSANVDPLMCLLVWSSRMLFALVGVPRRVKNVLLEVHPFRDGAGQTGVAAIQDRGSLLGTSQVFITCHSSALGFHVLDALGQELMTPVQLCMAAATTFCKLILAFLEPGFATSFLLISILPSSTSMVRDALSFRKLTSERQQFREWLLRRHRSSHVQDRRLAACFLKHYFGEDAEEHLSSAVPLDSSSPTINERVSVSIPDKAVIDEQLRQSCWELVKEMQLCLDQGDSRHLQAARDRLTKALLSRPTGTATQDDVEDRTCPTDKVLTKVREIPMLSKAFPSDQAMPNNSALRRQAKDDGELPDDLEAVCERFAVVHETASVKRDASDGTLTLTRSSRGADIRPAIIYSGAEVSSTGTLQDPAGYEEERDDFSSLSASIATFATNDERASSCVIARERDDLVMQLHAVRHALEQEVCTGAALRTQLAVAQSELEDYQMQTDRMLRNMTKIEPHPLGQRTPMTSEASVATRMKDTLHVDPPSMSTLPPEGFSSNGTMPPWTEPFAEAWKRLANLRNSLISGDDDNVGVPKVNLTASGDKAAGSAEVSSETITSDAHLTSESRALSADKAEVLTADTSAPTLSSRLSPVRSTRQSPSLPTRSQFCAADLVDPPEVALERVMLGDVQRRRTEPPPRVHSLMSQADQPTMPNWGGSDALPPGAPGPSRGRSPRAAPWQHIVPEASTPATLSTNLPSSYALGMSGREGSMAVPIVQQQLRSPQQAHRSTYPHKPTVTLPAPWATFNSSLPGGNSNISTPTMINREVPLCAAQFSTQPYSPTLPMRQVPAAAAFQASLMSPRGMS